MRYPDPDHRNMTKFRLIRSALNWDKKPGTHKSVPINWSLPRNFGGFLSWKMWKKRAFFGVKSVKFQVQKGPLSFVPLWYN